ncbi:MAG: hypothetical protein E2O39_13085 [Planctomycetota bacterium]|nr:MAG: hypothetical protein E2O39_13085 [Planctomycetota bacterium]
MARLILEEGGNTRRFNLKEGKLTIGSGEHCTLRLESEDVAEIHAELEFAKGGATLRLRQGVAPATVKGRKITGEHAMAHGVPVHLGSAKISVEFEGSEQATLVARRNVRTRAEAAGARSKSAVQPRAKVRKQGIPTAVIVVVGIVVAGVAWKFSVGVIGGTGKKKFDVSATYAQVRRLADQGDLTGVQAVFERIADEPLTDEWRVKFDAVIGEADDRRASALLAQVNQAGTVYIETQLRKFEKTYLKGKPDPPRVRVFLQRLTHFKEQWPQHPEVAWVGRMIQRYSKITDITQPKTFADIAFEVKTLTWAMPRDYKQAFVLLDAYVEDASGDEYEEVMALINEKEEERTAHFLDRILQAKYEWKKGERGRSVELLAQLVAKIGEPKMEDEAADLLLALPGIDDYLAGYKEARRDMFDVLILNAKVAERANEAGLL